MLFKVVVDLEQVDLNKLFANFNKNKVEICVANESLFLYTKANSQPSIGTIMKETNIENYFIKEIKEKPDINDGGFSQNWCRERLEQDEELQITSENQRQLNQMMKNIDDIKESLKAHRERGALNGAREERSSGIENHAGETEKDTDRT